MSNSDLSRLNIVTDNGATYALLTENGYWKYCEIAGSVQVLSIQQIPSGQTTDTVVLDILKQCEIDSISVYNYPELQQYVGLEVPSIFDEAHNPTNMVEGESMVLIANGVYIVWEWPQGSTEFRISYIPCGEDAGKGFSLSGGYGAQKLEGVTCYKSVQSWVFDDLLNIVGVTLPADMPSTATPIQAPIGPPVGYIEF